jgi:hypothetical protein
VEIINILAEILSENVKISQPAARGLFKLSLNDQLGPFKPLNQMEFKDFKDTIDNALRERLVELKISNLEKLISNLNVQLIEKQSLISMTMI